MPRGARRAVTVVVVHQAVERRVAGFEPALHLDDILRTHREVARDLVDLFARERPETLLRAPKIEEELALSLGRRDLDDAPVAEHELVDLGPDPVHRERDEAGPDGGVEALDRLHQSDVPLLNQVLLGKAVAAVAARHLRDIAKMRGDEPPRRFEIVVAPQPRGQLPFLVGAQQRECLHRSQVPLQVRGRCRQPVGKRVHVVPILDSGSPGKLRRRATGASADALPLPYAIWSREPEIQDGYGPRTGRSTMSSLRTAVIPGTSSASRSASSLNA